MNRINKIIVVSLCDQYTRKVARSLSNTLGMLFCDTKDMIEYELIDYKALEEKCSKAYLRKKERDVIKHIASFENVVVAISYDYLSHNLRLLKSGSVIVFLKLTKKFVKENATMVETISYEERCENLKKICQATITLRNTDEKVVSEKIIETLGGIL